MITLFQYYRIAAAFLIVMIHQQFWHSCAFVGGLKNCAVPLFACMAGYLYKGDLLKKVPRVIVPYIIWAAIYFLANNVVLDVFVRHEAFEFPGLRSWLLGGTACHLWFLPCLFIAFAMKSLMFKVSGLMFTRNNVSDNIKHQTSNFVLLLLALATQFISDETSATLLGYCRIYFGRLLLFFALGGLIRLLSPNPSHPSSYSHSLHLSLGASLAMLGLANLALRFIPGLAFQPLLLIVGLMVIAIGLGEFKLPKVVSNLANATMGIYLIHVLFTSAANFLFQKKGLTDIHPTMAFLLMTLIFTICYVATRILPKIMKG